MKAGSLMQLSNILVQAGIPQDRNVNVTEFRSGKYKVRFMDNEGIVRAYEITPSGSVIEETN